VKWELWSPRICSAPAPPPQLFHPRHNRGRLEVFLLRRLAQLWHLEAARFESRPVQRLSRWNFSWFASVPLGTCRDGVSMRSPFFTHRSTLCILSTDGSLKHSASSAILPLWSRVLEKLTVSHHFLLSNIKCNQFIPNSPPLYPNLNQVKTLYTVASCFFTDISY
jgi:hypothetical protein